MPLGTQPLIPPYGLRNSTCPWHSLSVCGPLWGGREERLSRPLASTLGADRLTTRRLSRGETPRGGGHPVGKAGVGSRVSVKEILEQVPLRKLLLTQLLS